MRMRGQASVEFLLVLGVSALLFSAGLQALSLTKAAAEKAFSTASAKQTAEALAYACSRALFTDTPLRFEVKPFSPLQAATKDGMLVLSFKGGRVSKPSSCVFSGEVAGRGFFEITPARDGALVSFRPRR